MDLCVCRGEYKVQVAQQLAVLEGTQILASGWMRRCLGSLPMLYMAASVFCSNLKDRECSLLIILIQQFFF
jgi:hypothetical protein